MKVNNIFLFCDSFMVVTSDSFGDIFRGWDKWSRWHKTIMSPLTTLPPPLKKSLNNLQTKLMGQKFTLAAQTLVKIPAPTLEYSDWTLSSVNDPSFLLLWALESVVWARLISQILTLAWPSHGHSVLFGSEPADRSAFFLTNANTVT